MHERGPAPGGKQGNMSLRRPVLVICDIHQGAKYRRHSAGAWVSAGCGSVASCLQPLLGWLAGAPYLALYACSHLGCFAKRLPASSLVLHTCMHRSPATALHSLHNLQACAAPTCARWRRGKHRAERCATPLLPPAHGEFYDSFCFPSCPAGASSPGDGNIIFEN